MRKRTEQVNNDEGNENRLKPVMKTINLFQSYNTGQMEISEDEALSQNTIKGTKRPMGTYRSLCFTSGCCPTI